MNHFHLKTTKDNDGKPIGPHEVHVQVTAEAIKTGFGEMLQYFEVPILQGRRQAWGEGGMEYWFELNDEDAHVYSQCLTMVFYGIPPLN